MEAGCPNRVIARHLCRSDAPFHRYWQKFINSGQTNYRESSGQFREKTGVGNRTIVAATLTDADQTGQLERVSELSPLEKYSNCTFQCRTG